MKNCSSNREICIHNAVKIICVMAIATMIAVSIAVYGAPVRQIVILTAFVVFYVQLPGMFVVKWAGLDKGHLSTKLMLGLMLGWMLVIGQYFVADAFANNFILYIGGPMMSAAYLYNRRSDSKRLQRQRGNDHKYHHLKIEKISTAFCIFFTLSLLFALLHTQYLYPNPEVDQIIYVNPDKAFHMGLINSLSHDYPLQSIWFSGVYFYYHIFTEILYAVPVRIFSVNADACVISFNPFLTAYVFCISLYAFFREMSQKTERSGIYCLIFLLSNVFIARDIKSSIALDFLLRNDNAAGFAISSTLIFIVAYSKWYDSSRNNAPNKNKILIVCMALIMLITGLKGPIGALVIASLWGTIALGIVLRRISAKTIPSAIFITAGFMLIYFTVLAAKGQFNSPSGPSLEFASITDISFWKDPLVSTLKAINLPKIMRLGILMIAFLVFFFTIFFIPFCAGYIREVILVLGKRKDYNPSRVLVYAECMVGMVAMFLLDYAGHSQIYFGLVTAILAPIVSFWFIEDMELCRTSSRGATIVKAVRSIMAMMLTITTILFGLFLFEKIGVAKKAADINKSNNKYMSMSNDEYKAMKWLKANTDMDVLVASDRYYSISLKRYSYKNRWKNRFFMYEAYSNRFCYISGSGYILHKEDNPERKARIENDNKLYDENYADRGELARELGIDYIILSKRFTGEKNLVNKDYELCYSNKDVDIYKVKQ